MARAKTLFAHGGIDSGCTDRRLHAGGFVFGALRGVLACQASLGRQRGKVTYLHRERPSVSFSVGVMPRGLYCCHKPLA
jgi:hypothetical protein